MRCFDCNYYESTADENQCLVTGAMYFHMVDNCDLVDDDQVVNTENLKRDHDTSMKCYPPIKSKD